MKKLSKEELFRSQEFWEENIKSGLFELVQNYMDEHKLTQLSMANKIGVSNGYLSQIFNGNSDHRLSKIVELSLAIGRAPYFYFKDITKVLDDAKKGESIFLDFEKLESNAKICDQWEADVDSSKEFSPIDTMDDISDEVEPGSSGSAIVVSFKKFQDQTTLSSHCSDKENMQRSGT